MKIENGLYRPIAMRWDSFSFPVAAGTPVSSAGVIANDATAVGLIPQTISARPLMSMTNVLVSGTVDLIEAQSSYGGGYTDAAIEAMSSITFVGADGTRVPDPLYDVPVATSSALGGVKIGNGISISSGKIAVKAKTNGGISVSSDGVAVAAATNTALGGVKMAANVSEAAGSAPTAAEFKALLDALIAAGIMAAPEEDVES